MQITSFIPATAAPGQKVTILGTGFTGATSVEFGGVESLVFFVISDTKIEAYPNITGTGTITVTTPTDTLTVVGFTQTLVRVRWPDLPQLARDVNDTDLVAVWDSIRNILCQATGAQLPAGTGGGGGGGNIYTALGSPFKVRVGDENYTYTPDPAHPTDDSYPGTVKITDLRLLGKSDYVVSATDVNGEFENDRLTYDEPGGSVSISAYKLTEGRHITIYADGVVSTAQQSYLLSVKDQMATFQKVLQPVLTMGGTVWPWRKPAIDIPAGWQEVTDFRGKVLVGQDLSDTTNGLNGANGTGGGGLTLPALTEANIPKIQLRMFSEGGNQGNLVDGRDFAPAWTSQKKNGNQDYDIKHTNDNDATLGKTSAFGSDAPTAIKVPYNPFKIVNWIEYIG